MQTFFRSKENTAAALHRVSLIMYGFLLVFFIVIVTTISVITWKSTDDYPYRNHVSFKDNWTDSNGNPVKIEKLHTNADIYKILPEVKEGTTLFFSVKTGNIKIYLEDELLYENELYETWFLGSTPGYLYVEVDIPSSASGKQIHVKLENPYGDHSSRIDDIYFGKEASIMSHKFNQLMGSFCLGAIMFCIGCIFLILFFVLRAKFDNATKWIHIGFFAVMTGIFIMMDSKMMQLMHGHLAIWHIIVEISLMLIPIPIFLYIIEEFNLKKKFYPFIIIILNVFEISLNIVLNLTNIKEFHETVFFTHCIIALMAVAGVHIVGNAMIRDFKHHIYDFVGLVIMLVGCLADGILYYTRSITITYIFLRIGIFGFLIFSGIQVISSLIGEYEGVVKGDVIRRLAYHDGLTDLYNRTSFIEEMDNLDKNVGECVLLAMFDVNNLKAVNDTLGHTAGDNLILSAANALSDGFSDVGKVYRIGGDEFVVIITGELIREKFEKGLKKYEEKIKEMNLTQNSYTISAAVGVESNVVSENCNMQSILEKADAAMYENKKEMKKGRKS